MQAYMQQNSMKALNADKLLPVMDAASISASKVFKISAMIGMTQQKMQSYMQPNWMQVLDAEFVLPVFDAV